jgi:hypothetical protein
LVGGLAGALLTGWIRASEPRSEPLAARPAASPDPPAAEPGRDGAAVELLLSTLIEEVQALRTSLGPGRQSAGDGELTGSQDLVAAIEELTAALRRASSGEAGSLALGRGLTTIDWPEGAARVDLLLELERIQDEQQRVRPFLLWNYQQILDHFGPPSFIYDEERWVYEVPATEELVEFHFQQGLLIHIY